MAVSFGTRARLPTVESVKRTIVRIFLKRSSAFLCGFLVLPIAHWAFSFQYAAGPAPTMTLGRILGSLLDGTTYHEEFLEEGGAEDVREARLWLEEEFQLEYSDGTIGRSWGTFSFSNGTRAHFWMSWDRWDYRIHYSVKPGE